MIAEYVQPTPLVVQRKSEVNNCPGLDELIKGKEVGQVSDSYIFFNPWYVIENKRKVVNIAVNASSNQYY
ncbi:hypothetical protein H8D57_03690 [bacterium]|nr:hypothetical protein [bacterium]